MHAEIPRRCSDAPQSHSQGAVAFEFCSGRSVPRLSGQSGHLCFLCSRLRCLSRQVSCCRFRALARTNDQPQSSRHVETR